MVKLILGRLGNSGNSNGAHLHFNVVDRSRTSQAEGLPYVFDWFDWRGTTTAEAAFGGSAAPLFGSQTRERALPLNGVVLSFGKSQP